MIYLDNAATTLQKPETVKKAVLRAFELCANSGRGGYKEAMEASEMIYNARLRVGEFFGASDISQVAFTQNATHALNIAIKGVARRGNCVISGYEHNSVVRPVMALKKSGVNCIVATGRLFDCDDMVRAFKKAIKRNTVFAVCTHVSNVFGYVLPIKEIDELCYRKGVPLIIDASQSAGGLPINLSEMKAAICICAPGHKGLYGPQGTGVLVCKNGEKLKTFFEGGTGSVSSEYEQPSFMPDRFESGTQNSPGIAGLSEGIAYVQECGIENICRYEQELTGYIISGLSGLDGITVYSAKDRNCQTGVLSFSSENMSADAIAEKLAEERIAVRSGMHCAPLAHKSVGTKHGTVRVSTSSFTTLEDVESFIDAMYKITKKR